MPDLHWLWNLALQGWSFLLFLSSPEYVTPLTPGAFFLPLLVGLPIGITLDAFLRHAAGRPWHGLKAYFTEDKDWTLKTSVSAVVVFVVLAKVLMMNFTLAILLGVFADNIIILLRVLWNLLLTLIPGAKNVS